MPTSPRLSPERLDIGDSQLISSFLIHCDRSGEPKPCGRGWTGTKPPGCQRASAKKSATTPKKSAKSASKKIAETPVTRVKEETKKAKSKGGDSIESLRANYKPKMSFGNGLLDVGNLMSVYADEIEADGSVDPGLVKSFEKGSRNWNPATIVQKGKDSYVAIGEDSNIQAASARKSGKNGRLFSVVMPDDPKEIEVAKALQVKDLKPVNGDRQTPRNLMDEGNLKFHYGEDINPPKTKGHAASDKDVEETAKLLLKNNSRNWVPVLVEKGVDGKFNVVGNHFAYDVAQKAGLERMWTVELPPVKSTPEKTAKPSRSRKKKMDSLFETLLKHCDRSSSAPKPCGKGWVGTKPPGCKRTIVQGGTKKANEIREGQKKKPAVSKPVKPVRPKESIDVGDARYAKGMKALRVNKESRDGFKGDLEQLIENLGGRWSNREKAYIVSPSKTKKILDLEKSNPADRNTNVDLAWAFRPKMPWDKDKGLKPSADFIQRHEQIYGAHQKQSKPKLQAIAGGKPRDKSLKELFQEADNVGSKYQDPKDPPSMSAKREANKILEESGYNEAIARGMGKVKKLPKPKKDPLYDEKVAQLLGEKRARSKTPPKTGKGPRKSTDIFGNPIPIRKNVSIDSLESWLLQHDRRAYV